MHCDVGLQVGSQTGAVSFGCFLLKKHKNLGQSRLGVGRLSTQAGGGFDKRTTELNLKKSVRYVSGFYLFRSLLFSNFSVLLVVFGFSRLSPLFELFADFSRFAALVTYRCFP